MTGAQEALDAIDAALDDPSVSDDAMRWNPDREAARRRIVAREQIRRNVSITVPPLLTPEEVARAVEQFTELREALRPAFETFETFARTVEEFGGSLAKAAEAIRTALLADSRIPPPPRTLRDTDPRAYALELRRTRNTGPDRQVQHRPPPRRVR